MRAKDAAVGLGAFLIGYLLGERVVVRLWLDLSDRSGDPPFLSFASQAPKTLVFMGVVPFLVVLRTAMKRHAFAGVAVPSFLSGFVWLVFYGCTAWAAVSVLHAGRPPRFSTGVLALLLMIVVPALLEYGIFAAWAWLSSRPGVGRVG